MYTHHISSSGRRSRSSRILSGSIRSSNCCWKCRWNRIISSRRIRSRRRIHTVFVYKPSVNTYDCDRLASFALPTAPARTKGSEADRELPPDPLIAPGLAATVTAEGDISQRDPAWLKVRGKHCKTNSPVTWLVNLFGASKRLARPANPVRG